MNRKEFELIARVVDQETRMGRVWTETVVDKTNAVNTRIVQATVLFRHYIGWTFDRFATEICEDRYDIREL